VNGIKYGFLFLLFLIGCSKDWMEIPKTSVTGKVFRDSTFTTPAKGVFALLRINEGDMGDLTTFTDESGKYFFSFYIGHQLNECTYDLNQTARIEVRLIWNGTHYDFDPMIVEPGKAYKLPPVHLGLFEGD